ncbi:sulfatase [Lentisphaera marina]|uniref:sulfatase n=1 Tax=Lentisphaera marina TaxID=1111041 RepID=UPI0023671A00|nr:sulfatase [Lentisphaera marina]MDD7987272.1 sulfatase [Lentisphaera marina]
MRILYILISLLFFGNILAEDNKKPNVLFISIDDMNHWISAMRDYQAIYDYPAYKTPNIDRLLARGMFFTNAHVPGGSCKPSRVSVFTGVAVSKHGVYRNPHTWQLAPKFKNRDDVSIMQRFRKEGYFVAGGGKNFHTYHPGSWDEYINTEERDPKDRAADMVLKKKFHEANKAYEIERKRQMKALTIKDKSKADAIKWGPLDCPPEAMPDAFMVDYIIRKLNEKRNKPFFLGCGFTKPHLAWAVPRKYFDMYPLDEIPTPVVKENDIDDLGQQGQNMAGGATHDFMVKSGLWKSAIQGYLASCTFVDDQIGRLLDAIDASPEKDNTIIMLWSDHGWHFGDKGHWKKFATWEETTHIPMGIIAPGVTKAGQKTHRPVNAIDLYPTLLELCGLEPNPELDGHSLVPLLDKPDREWNYPSLTTHSRGYNTVRTQKWRLIEYPRDNEMELYDHSNDPLEHNNLINNPEYAHVMAELKAMMPKTNAPEIVEIEKTIDSTQREILGKKIRGPIYTKAMSAGREAALASEPGQEHAAVDKVILDIITQAKADGAYDQSKIRTEMVGTNNKKVYYEKAGDKK